LIGQIDHVTFGLFCEIGQVEPEPRFSIARRMALGIPRMMEASFHGQKVIIGYQNKTIINV